eukprot:1152346-Pelagomonas_calceolata.AAC.12
MAREAACKHGSAVKHVNAGCQQCMSIYTTMSESTSSRRCTPTDGKNVICYERAKRRLGGALHLANF